MRWAYLALFITAIFLLFDNVSAASEEVARQRAATRPQRYQSISIPLGTLKQLASSSPKSLVISHCPEKNNATRYVHVGYHGSKPVAVSKIVQQCNGLLPSREGWLGPGLYASWRLSTALYYSKKRLCHLFAPLKEVVEWTDVVQLYSVRPGDFDAGERWRRHSPRGSVLVLNGRGTLEKNFETCFPQELLSEMIVLCELDPRRYFRSSKLNFKTVDWPIEASQTYFYWD